MPIRAVGESVTEYRWLFSFRWIDDIDAERARQRFTLNYRFTDRFQAGLELNPLADDYGPLANLIVLTETEKRPALMVGTSSDRIGTESGQAYFGTLSKSLEPLVGLPASPYVGVSFADKHDDWEFIAGLNYRLLEQRLSVTHLWDGENLHTTLDVPWRNHNFGIVIAHQQDDEGGDRSVDEGIFLGLTYGLRF